uniref:Reverse transcriptase domain-containing protein n=1 Tax=Tanacetum cinerariifolium TaxID=118510 RepID=A0A6L2J4T3_TANCI|nr:reverse transcriptase domain-containing protein [Tanacetum cinerariifolium]
MDLVDYLSDVEEEEEPSAPTDHASPIPDSVPSSEETETFETDESAATPPSPYKSIKAHTVKYATTLIPPSPPPSPLSPLSSPLPRIPSPPLLLPSPTRRDIIPEVDMPLRKRARFTAPSHMFETEESSAAVLYFCDLENGSKETPMSDAAIKTLITQGVADVLADYEANKGSGNRHDSHDLGSGGRRPVPTARMCTYKDFINYQLLKFKGIEGVVGLTQWFEKMESVFYISSYTVENQVKSKIKKLEIEIWNLKVPGQIEKYVSGISDMIQGKVMPARPKTMQEEIELANDLMDQKVCTFAERQAENKRKLESNPRDNQAQQQPFKRKNVARAYTARPGEKKEYGGTLPLCTKCNYHHIGSCATKCNNYKRLGTVKLMERLMFWEVVSPTLTRSETLIIRGDRSESRLNIISCTKNQKYPLKGCHVFLAQITEKKAEDKSEEKRLKDVLVVRDFPKVFLEDLPGVLPTRQLDFQIDLVPGAAPVARAPYRLASSEMKNYQTNCKGFLIKALEDQVHHLVELWFCSSRRMMDCSGCVSTIES